MVTKNKKVLIPILLVVLLSLLLVNCSCTEPEAESTPAETTGKTAESSVENTESNAPDQPDVIGKYEITAMVTDGKETTPEDLELMKSKGLNCLLTLKADGTGVLDLFGETSDLTWDGSTVKTSDKSFSYTLQGDQLILTDGASSLTFMRTEQ